MSGITERCNEIGLPIYHTNWRCWHMVVGK